MVTKFYSEKSIFFFILILILPITVGIYFKIRYESFFMILTLLLITFFNLYMFFFTYYIVKDDKLIVKTGFFTYKIIYLKEIKEIKDDKTIRRSLATGINNRIEIFYGESSIIISPKNKIEFLKEINYKLKYL